MKKKQNQMQIETHLVVKILLEYNQNQTIKCWAITRTLNRMCKNIVDNQKYDKGIWGRRRWISTSVCDICDKKGSCPNEMLMYNIDDITNRRIISHCNNWMCRMSALYSMIQHYKGEGVYLLRKPLIDVEIIIPRSDGSETKGHCKNKCLVKRNDDWYVICKWFENNEGFSKLVPLKHYTQDLPKIIFEE